MIKHNNSAQKSLRYDKLLHRGSRTVWAVIRAVFLLGFAFVILYPVLSMISKAFMESRDLYDSSVLWIPKHWTLKNVAFAWEQMDYPSAFLRSFGYSLSGTIIQTLICTMAGYAFARFEFPLKKIWFVFVILSILIPPQMILMPLYLHMIDFDLGGIITLIFGHGLNLTKTSFPFFLVSFTGFGLRNGLFIFLLRQSFRGMPKETEEAALVDGAGPARIFLRIMLPSALSVLVTVMLFSFVWMWNDTDYASALLSNERMLPQAFDIFNSYMRSANNSSETVELFRNFDLTDSKVIAMLRSAGVLLVMAPLLIVYLIAQRFFVESIDRSGLVG